MVEDETKATDFAIELDVSTLRRSAAGQIAGVIFIRLGGVAFPEATWSDLVAALLAGWAQSLLPLLYGEQSVATWHFMDGPFRAELRRTSNEALTVTTLQDRKVGSRTHQVAHDVSLQSVLSQFRDVSNSLLTECNRRGWRSPDLTELISVSRELALRG
jgi:hypothetical protein